jgi:hypothetical protein
VPIRVAFPGALPAVAPSRFVTGLTSVPTRGWWRIIQIG